MFEDSRYCKVFVSDNLTRRKYNELHSFAVSLRDRKNEISGLVCSNLDLMFNHTQTSFITEMRSRGFGISSSFDAAAYAQVFDCYRNKFDAIIRRITFRKTTYLGCEFYKRDTARHRRGDIKYVKVKTASTPLSICLTYLARYGNDGILDYIQENIASVNEDKRRFYRNILDECEKFGFERLMKLAMSRRGRIIAGYSKHPVEFRSLTFSGRSRKKRIIDWNRGRRYSEISAFVSLSGLRDGSFDIPVKFSPDWHGEMEQYLRNANEYEYTLTFDERKHRVSVCLCVGGKRFLPEAGMSEGSVIGLDVNVKHNLFCLSDGRMYDYDHRLVRDYCELCLKEDRLKSAIPGYRPGRRLRFKEDAMRRRMRHSEQDMIAGICAELMHEGVTHVVMEDLDNGFGKQWAKTEEERINWNRKIHFLGISSLKQEFDHIARKYGIAVSVVQNDCTSITCPVCGLVDDASRPSQEIFRCTNPECGHEDNADVNAAINIKNRVLATVLSEQLLKQKDNGAFEPKKNLKKGRVLKVLESYRTSLAPTGKVENLSNHKIS